MVAEYELRATQREASPSWEFAAEDIRAVLAAAPLPSDTPADGLGVERLMAWLGPSHPHDEGRECGTCAAYNYLAATLDHREQP